MRRKGFSLILLVFVLTACSVVSGHSERSDLLGKWRWIRSTGGFAGTTSTPDSAGASEYFIIYSFPNTFTYTRADTFFRRGIYSLHAKGDGSAVHYETANDGFLPDQRASFLSRDTLILLDRCADCYRSTYVRVR